MRLFVLPLLTLALALPAFAVDGVVEINQTCAVNTGCFSGDAAGFPVTISQTGSYRLTSDLSQTTTTNHTIHITNTAQNVTIDLNGFSIQGPNSCSGGGSSITCTFVRGGGRDPRPPAGSRRRSGRR